MIYSNVDFNVVYVDPSIGTAGDGTTPAGALKALPANAADFTDNTCYLIRRTQESYATIIPNGENTNITNLLLLGMPNPSDLMYDFVPEEAKNAWGADEAEYANVKSVVAGRGRSFPASESAGVPDAPDLSLPGRHRLEQLHAVFLQ